MWILEYLFNKSNSNDIFWDDNIKIFVFLGIFNNLISQSFFLKKMISSIIII